MRVSQDRSKTLFNSIAIFAMPAKPNIRFGCRRREIERDRKRNRNRKEKVHIVVLFSLQYSLVEASDREERTHN